MSENTRRFHGAKWAPFRFGVVGPLLSSPPAKGELQTRLQELAGMKWLPPGYGIPVTIGLSTIERWYYRARAEKDDPIRALRRKVRQDQGEQWSLSEPLRRALCAQHRTHKRWSYQLHWDNLRALADRDKTIGDVPAYSTIRRYMKAHGMFPQPRRGDPNLPGVQRAEQHLEAREVRSYEAGHPTRSGTSTSTPPRDRCSTPRASGSPRTCWASSTTSLASAATCSGTSARPPPSSSTR